MADPYTKIEMMALAEVYDRKADTLRHQEPLVISGSSRPQAAVAT
jgi:hypothetical protein